MYENKIYVSELEYERLCRLDGRMDALIEYIQEKEKGNGFVDTSVIKAIVGRDNFIEEKDEPNV